MNFPAWVGFAVFLLSAIGATQAQTVVVPEADFPKLLLRIRCDSGCESSTAPPRASAWFREGDPGYEEPGELPVRDEAGHPSWVLGFPLSGYQKALHTQSLPWAGGMAVVLNERTSSGAFHGFLTLWTRRGNQWSLDQMVAPPVSAEAGDFILKASRPTGQGAVILLEAIGHDAGLNVQTYAAYRLSAKNRAEYLGSYRNRSETGIESVLAALNAGETPPPVFDSTAHCRLAKDIGFLDCHMRRLRIQHTLEGPLETDLGSSPFRAPLTKED